MGVVSVGAAAAAVAVPSRILISSTTTSSVAATINLSSIPQTYKHLHLVIDGPRSTNVSNIGDLSIRFNSLSTALYGSVSLIQTAGGGTFSGNGTANAAQISLSGAVTYSNQNGYVDMMIYDYRAARAKRLFTHFSVSNERTIYNTGFYFGVWDTTSAITQINLIASTYSFNTGFVINLYGITG
jgi:hypothetical protein